MEQEYKDKYIKYKSKYLILKREIVGGYDIKKIVEKLRESVYEHLKKKKRKIFFTWLDAQQYDKQKDLNLIFLSAGECRGEILLIDKLIKRDYKIGTVVFMDPIYNQNFFLNEIESIVHDVHSDELLESQQPSGSTSESVKKIVEALNKCIENKIFKKYLLVSTYGELWKRITRKRLCDDTDINKSTFAKLSNIKKVPQNKKIILNSIMKDENITNKINLSDCFSIHAVIGIGFQLVGKFFQQNEKYNLYMLAKRFKAYSKFFKKNNVGIVYPNSFVEFQSNTGVKILSWGKFIKKYIEE